MFCFPNGGPRGIWPFVYYAYICTWITRNLKETVPWSIITWPVLGNKTYKRKRSIGIKDHFLVECASDLHGFTFHVYVTYKGTPFGWSFHVKPNKMGSWNVWVITWFPIPSSTHYFVKRSGKAPPRDPTPYHFVLSLFFDREGIPFLYILLISGTVPLSDISSRELFIPFNSCKSTSF